MATPFADHLDQRVEGYAVESIAANDEEQADTVRVDQLLTQLVELAAADTAALVHEVLNTHS